MPPIPADHLLKAIVPDMMGNRVRQPHYAGRDGSELTAQELTQFKNHF